MGLILSLKIPNSLSQSINSSSPIPKWLVRLDAGLIYVHLHPYAKLVLRDYSLELEKECLESFLAWTWITTQGEPFNIKAMVVSFPLNNIQLLVHLPKIYICSCMY